MAVPSAEALKCLPPAALAGLVCEVAASGDVDGARVLIKAGVSLDVGTPYDQRTPLHLAAATGNLKMVQFLIEECKVPLKRDRFGLLPINDAVENGHAEVRRYLQGIKLEWAKEKAEARRRVGRARAESIDNFGDLQWTKQESVDELMGTVFELIVKEGVFSYTTVYAEVSHFFKGLGLHPMYFEHFTAMQIAKHVHCLIAAKRVAQATNDPSRMDFVLTGPRTGTFLCTIDNPNPTDAQQRTEVKVARHLDSLWAEHTLVSLTFMASEGALYKGGQEKLGIFTTRGENLSGVRLTEGETSLEVLASSRFLKEKSRPAKEQYQIVMEDVISSGRAVVRIVSGDMYPGPHKGGFVLLFGVYISSGRTYLTEVLHALRFLGISPRRFYLESFANRVITYSIFLPWAQENEVEALGRTIMYTTILKTTDIIYDSVIQARISHEVGLYLASGVKFVYHFFPKEQYAPEYVDVWDVLQKDPTSQRKLESLYKLCMKDLLSVERIFELIHRHMDLAVKFFDDFKSIALGTSKPTFNMDLSKAIDQEATDEQDRQILKMFLTFNHSILLTNFFKAESPGALAFRLDPEVALRGRPTSLYPDIPYGIYMVSGRNFVGFHTRFRDVARGGIRLVLSRDQTAYDRNAATMFDECYNLAYTQQMKNKDIPEGGSKGVILPDLGSAMRDNCHKIEVQRSCFTKYLGALLDCMMAEQCGLYTGHMKGRKEILYFGPDENTANFMDLGADLGRTRGYSYWKALTTGKSVKLGGVPHDTYGMTTASVHTYVAELLEQLGEEEENITKFQTGGPDGDLGSNEILVSRDRTIAIVDGSGVAYDPEGLNRQELEKLARQRRTIRHFARGCLSSNGFLVLVEDVNVTLPDGSLWPTGAQLRDNFHLTSYAAADLFVPCGGRPNAVNPGNVRQFIGADSGKLKFRFIVEGANLFFTDAARQVLEELGVHIFKDASTNKGGVCSSSLEVLAALALPDEDHTKCMTYNPEQTPTPPMFYADYVDEILAIIVENARSEFRAIWDCNQKQGTPKIECTSRLSVKINQICDSIQSQFQQGMTAEEKQQLVQVVLKKALPPSLLEAMSLEQILKQVPENYIAALVGAWAASRFVYQNGINASEVNFFFFMRSLISSGAATDDQKQPQTLRKRTLVPDEASNGDEPPLTRPRS